MKKILFLSLGSLFAFIPHLHSISVAEYIQHYGIRRITESVFGDKSLSLSHKRLTSLEGLHDIPGIDQIKTLDLAYNQLQTLPAGIFSGLQNLKIIYLHGNQLKTLPADIFTGLHNLQKLCLHDNQLQELPGGIFNELNSLRRLTIQGNPFRVDFLIHLPNSTYGISTLMDTPKYLDEALGSYKPNSISLAEYIKISGIPKIRDIGYGYGKELDLSYRGLTSLEGLQNIPGIDQVRRLKLDSNQLQTLPSGIFDGFNSLESVVLRDNPFSGDFLFSLSIFLRNIPTLKYLDDMIIDDVLKYKRYRVYQPKTLKATALKYLMQNLTPEQLEELAEANHPAFDLLPLTPQQRAAIIAKNIDSYDIDSICCLL